MTVFYDNPAGRLHRVLTDLKGVNPGTMTVKDAWAQALKVKEPAKHMEKLSLRIVRVFQLPVQVSTEVEQIDDSHFDRQFAMRWYKPIETTFARALFSTSHISQVTGNYGDDPLAALEHCSFILHQFRREALPDEGDLANIRRLISEIESEVAVSGDIDDTLRDFLLRHVRAMGVAIDDFFITGATGLEDMLDQALGAAVRRSDVMSSLSDSTDEQEQETETESVLRKFWALLARVGLMLSITANLAALGHSAYTALESAPAKPPAIEHVTEVEQPSVGEIKMPPANPTADRG